MFVNGYKWLDIIEDCERFLKKMEELKPYIVELNKDGIMKDKKYALDYAIGKAI